MRRDSKRAELSAKLRSARQSLNTASVSVVDHLIRARPPVRLSLSEKPSPMTVFDALYTIAAKDGRGEALFGNSFDIARGVYERTLIGDGYPEAYIEFPLLGSPGFDLLSVHSFVQPRSRFAPGAGFGYQKMFDWYSSVCGTGASVGCGIELDTSVGETERAGVYLQYRRHSNLIAPFLDSIGEEGRTESFLAVFDRMPEGWPPAYVGLFPGRVGTPLRIGGYLGNAVQKACADDPALLAAQFDRIGFSAYDDEMLSQCGVFLSIAPSVDFQFDIMPDGTLGDVFGLSLSFNETKPRQAQACMEDGYGAQICSTLQEWGWQTSDGSSSPAPRSPAMYHSTGKTDPRAGSPCAACSTMRKSSSSAPLRNRRSSI